MEPEAREWTSVATARASALATTAVADLTAMEGLMSKVLALKSTCLPLMTQW